MVTWKRESVILNAEMTLNSTQKNNMISTLLYLNELNHHHQHRPLRLPRLTHLIRLPSAHDRGIGLYRPLCPCIYRDLYRKILQPTAHSGEVALVLSLHWSSGHVVFLVNEFISRLKVRDRKNISILQDKFAQCQKFHFSCNLIDEITDALSRRHRLSQDIGAGQG